MEEIILVDSENKKFLWKVVLGGKTSSVISTVQKLFQCCWLENSGLAHSAFENVSHNA